MFKRSMLTKALVFLSIVLSCTSLITTARGWGEIYPFFYWKLFSQPNGSHHQDHVYRIYVPDSDSILKRLPIEHKATYTKDDIMYSLAYFVSDTLYGKEKLRALCRYLYPEFREYHIYKEEYAPLDILRNPDNYDTILVTKIP